MKKILHLISSPRKEMSFSIKLGQAVVSKLLEAHPDATVEEVNLVEQNAPHLDSAHLQSFFTPPEQLTPDGKDAIRYSDEAIRQLFEADFVVIGTPLYNFGIHSSLKAWIDHIARAGKTFRYSEQGPEGLVKGKKVYIAMSSGGVYSEGPYQAFDFASTYLKAVLAFLGMTDVEVVRAEGVNMPALKDQALEKAIESIVV